MVSFTFRAIGADGEMLSGELVAPDREVAIAQLQARGAVPLRILTADAASPLASLRRALNGDQRLSHTHRVELLQRLATLLAGGVAVEAALEIMASGRGSRNGGQVETDLLRQLREGEHLADAMARHEGSFPPIVVGMIRAGETSGALADTLARLAAYMQLTEASRQAIKSALVYPAILLATATCSILVVLLVVLPALRPAIMDSGNTLPLSTQLAFLVSDGIMRYWLLLAIVASAAALSIWRVLISPALRTRRDGLILRLPMIGTAMRQVEVARFARTLGVLVEGGVALPTALALAQPVVSNAILSEAISEVALRLQEGEGLSKPLAQTKCFPELAIQLIRIGEATGRLGEMLIQLSDIFDMEVRRAIDRGLAIAVPLLTIGLGLMVAGIVASVVLALLNVNDLIK